MIVHKKNNNYLVFVGSGRTGSTLVGQLLNKHPNIAISSELRVLTNALKKLVLFELPKSITHILLSSFIKKCLLLNCG